MPRPRYRRRSAHACLSAQRTAAAVPARPCAAGGFRLACGRRSRSNSRWDGRGLRTHIGVEVEPVDGLRNKAGADREVAEALALLPIGRISRENRIERRDDALVVEVLGVKLAHARAVKGGAEIEVVAAGTFADQADLGDIGPRTA